MGALDREERRYVPRLARALVRAMAAVRGGVPLEELAAAIHAGDLVAAMRLFPATDVEGSLAPSAAISRDALEAGGKVSARTL